MSHLTLTKTILIIEPDKKMAERMIGLVSKHFSAARIIGVADTARYALTLAKAEHPDLIVTELADLGMTGRDFLEQIKAFLPDVSRLIVSSLDYPELVAAAFRGGAVDYLIKPVSDTAILSALERAFSLRAETGRLRSVQDRYDSYRLMAKPLLEQLLLDQVCQPVEPSNKDDLPSLRDFLVLLDREGLVSKPALSLSCLVVTFPSGKPPLEATRVGLYQDTLHSLCDCIVSPLILGRLTVLLFSIPGKPSPQEVADAFRTRMHTAGTELSVGVGGATTTLAGCRQSYQEAVVASNAATPQDDATYQAEILPHIQEMLRLIDAQDLTTANRVFERLCEPLLLERNLPFDFAIRRMLWVTLETAHLRGIPHDQLSEVLLSLAGTTDLPALSEQAGEVFALFARPHHQESQSFAHQVDRYLAEHYADLLSLQEVAEHFNLTPYYFSRRYKQATGIHFHEKLAAIRIDHAKILLRNHPISIKEVATLVGYHEPAYFSKVFTRMVGVSPATYKKNIGL